MFIFLIILAIIIAFIVIVYLFVRQPKFGRVASGSRLAAIQQSPHYKNGSFQNLSHTPTLTEGSSYSRVMREFFFGKKPRVKPTALIPTVKTNLLELAPADDVLVWFGHSSYFMQLDGKRLLVDPVLSGAASPVRFTTRAFTGTDIYTTADLPDIDYLFISHDHWDHLDYSTVKQLQPRVGKVICGLGTGAHLERWGYQPEQIIEKDWYETVELDAGFTVHTVPARHFSGRGLRRNQALWLSFALITPTMRIFIGGDSGYDTHFAAAGAAYGPFDLAILENGQYNKNWQYIHMLPEQLVPAAKDLQARKLLTVHHAKFVLGTHPWDEPLEQAFANTRAAGIPLLTPMIGERVDLKGQNKLLSQWWSALE